MLNQSSVSVAERVPMATFDPNNNGNLKSKCKMFKTDILYYLFNSICTYIDTLHICILYMYKSD